jgi:hypothetical protein
MPTPKILIVMATAAICGSVGYILGVTHASCPACPSASISTPAPSTDFPLGIKPPLTGGKGF